MSESVFDVAMSVFTALLVVLFLARILRDVARESDRTAHLLGRLLIRETRAGRWTEPSELARLARAEGASTSTAVAYDFLSRCHKRGVLEQDGAAFRVRQEQLASFSTSGDHP